MSLTLAALLLTGCVTVGEGASEEGLFVQARDVSLGFRAEVADVQMQIFDGEWRMVGYGDSSRPCNPDGYGFSLRRTTPEGWMLPGTLTDTVSQVSTWLLDNAWNNVEILGYGPEIAEQSIRAHKLDANIQRLVIKIRPGQNFDIVVIEADTTCQPGDQHALILLADPAIAEGVTTPRQDGNRSGRPGAVQSFGYDIDGNPRFWDPVTGEEIPNPYLTGTPTPDPTPTDDTS